MYVLIKTSYYSLLSIIFYQQAGVETMLLKSWHKNCHFKCLYNSSCSY